MLRNTNRLWRHAASCALLLVTTGVGLVGTQALAQCTPGNTLRVAHPFPIQMDVFGANQGDRFQLTLNRAVFDQLTERDDSTNDIVPGLATSWERTNDTTWVFHLRSGVHFHDGSPLTAADVKATLDYFIQQKGTLAPLLKKVTSIDAPDSSTVVFTTSTPDGTLPFSLSLFSITPASKLQGQDFSLHPVGSGPFKFVRFVPGNRVVLEANQDYWQGAPKLACLEFDAIPEASSRITALTTGEIDVTWGLTADQARQLNGNTQITLTTVPAFLNAEILINIKRPPLNDTRVRQAMAYAINKKAIADSLLGPGGSVADSVVSSSIFGAVPQTPYTYDPAKARALLADAGYSNGIQTTVLLRPQQQEQDLMLAIISDWAKVGIDVKPNAEEMATWVSDYVAQNWDMAMVFRPTLTGDADYTLGRLYTTKANRVPFANAKLDALLNEAGAAADPKQRLEYYGEAEKMIWDNAWGIYPFNLNEIYAFRSRVKGFVAAASTTPSFYSVQISGQ